MSLLNIVLDRFCLCATCCCGKYEFTEHSLGQVLSLCDPFLAVLCSVYSASQFTWPTAAALWCQLHADWGRTTGVLMCKCWTVLMCKCWTVLLYNCWTVLMCKCWTVLMCKCWTVLMWKCWTVLKCKCLMVLMCKCWTVLMYKCWTVLMYKCRTVVMYVQALNSVDVQMLKSGDIQMLNSVDFHELNNVCVKVLNSVDVQVLNSVNVLVLTSTVRSWQSTGILMSKCLVVLMCRYSLALLVVSRALGCWHTSIEWHCWLFTEHSGVDVQASVVRQSVDLQPGVAGGVLLLPDGGGRHSALHHRPHDHQHWAERQPAPWAEAHHCLHRRGAAGSARDSAEAAVAGGEGLLQLYAGWWEGLLQLYAGWREGFLQLYAGWWGVVTTVCWVERGDVTAVCWVERGVVTAVCWVERGVVTAVCWVERGDVTAVCWVVRGRYSCMLGGERGCYSCMLGGKGSLQLYAGWWEGS